MSVYQPHLSLVTLSLRPTQHLKTQDSYTPLWEASRQQRGVACAECIPYLAIDRGENDWQREPEVSEPPSALRACLVTKMAEALHDSATKQVSDVLELLQTGEYWNTFRKERRGRLKSFNSSKRQHMHKGTRKCFAVFAKTL